MPFENPEPGIYWGYRCLKCRDVIALAPHKEGTGWNGGGAFTLDCMNRDCQFKAIYPLADIRPIEVPPAA